MIRTRLILIGQILANVAAGLLLVTTVCWLVAEQDWKRKDIAATNQDAFVRGTLGLETAPLKMLLALDRIVLDKKTGEVASDVFQFHQEAPMPWPKQYGFLAQPQPLPAGTKPCEVEDNEVDRRLLPLGFTVTNRLPLSAWPTPVKFAGLSCSLCHSEGLHTKGGPVKTVIGGGSTSLNLIAWGDGFENLVMDPRLTETAILDGYYAKCDKPTGLWAGARRWLELKIVGAWLRQSRATMQTNSTMYDLPYSGRQLIDPHMQPAGPSRTRPFRSIVRTALFLPGGDNYAFSKVPGVFLQEPSLRPRSQFDGSIGSPDTRSMVAAYTSGSSIEALAQPAIEHNIRAAASFTLRLGSSNEILTYANFAGQPPDPTRVQRGYAIYMRHCNSCHGNRSLEDGRWSLTGANEHGKIVDISEIGTDPERIIFPDSDILVPAVYGTFPAPPDQSANQVAVLQANMARGEADQSGSTALLFQSLIEKLDAAQHKYPKGHPFSYPIFDLQRTNGFINNPIPFAWLRAPYLHNGSVPTLAQLIGLEKRPTLFCRGDNDYDLSQVGLSAPPPAKGKPDGAPVCPADIPFLYDTAERGNSNVGHEFPYSKAINLTPAQKQELEDLLEYLKTI